MPPLVLALILFIVSLNAIAQVLLRKAMITISLPAQGSFNIPSLIGELAANPYFWGGISLYGVSLIAWLVVLSKVEVSLAYPFQSLGYILIAIMSFYFLGESVTFSRSIGITLICVGLFFIAQSA